MIQSYGIINDNAPHLVADIAEIMCFFENRDVSRGDVENILYVKGGNGLLQDLDLSETDSAEANEKFQALSEEVFQHLRYREVAFGDWYPFYIEGDIIGPKLPISDQYLIYGALLGFSRLQMFTPAGRVAYASDFERLCVSAAHGFAEGWVVKHFGKGGADRAEFGNKLRDALLTLASRLQEQVLEAVNEIPDQNVGDAGIDIVVFREWADPARGVPAYFAQCAAQKDGWPAKRLEAHHANLEKYFAFFHKPGNIMFTPVCYRSPDGRWVDSAGHQAILIDRLRLIELFRTLLRTADDPLNCFADVPKPFTLGCAA